MTVNPVMATPVMAPVMATVMATPRTAEERARTARTAEPQPKKSPVFYLCFFVVAIAACLLIVDLLLTSFTKEPPTSNRAKAATGRGQPPPSRTQRHSSPQSPVRGVVKTPDQRVAHPPAHTQRHTHLNGLHVWGCKDT